ncbi:MAG: hypothetical protein ACREM1_21070 [Longimicrobiales bacterium]
MVICVTAGGWGEDGIEACGRAVLEAGAVPRIAVEAGRLWADGGGVQVGGAVTELRRVLWQAGAREVRCGVARTPIAAWAAASAADAGSIRVVGSAQHAGSAAHPGSAAEVEATRVVEDGTDRAFVATLGLECLEPDPRLRALLEGVGIVTCGQLAAVPREAIEVRFGGEAVAVWQLARAEDRRRLFGPIAAERPHASLDFVDYVVTDTDQLLFTANALIANLCGRLSGHGEHARAMRLDLALANGERWSRVLQPARPTAGRSVWLRLARSVLDRLTVPDAVAGVELQVQATEAASSIQGDLFDSGFATAGAVDAALARLIETHGPLLVRPEPVAHPLPERGTRFRPIELYDQERPERRKAGRSPPRPPATTSPSSQVPSAGRRSLAAPTSVVPAAPAIPAGPALQLCDPHTCDSVDAGMPAAPAGLTLQLLPCARPVHVETVRRRDHHLPVRYRDGRWNELATVAGPERISGGTGEETYAREYFRGVTAEGTLILLFRDARADAWYLHGWWD